jgi:hypothetical protein
MGLLSLVPITPCRCAGPSCPVSAHRRVHGCCRSRSRAGITIWTIVAICQQSRGRGVGHFKATARPVDFQHLDALFGQDREAGLDPVVDRQPAVRRGPGPRHERQPTARDTARKLTPTSVLNCHSYVTVLRHSLPVGVPRVLVTCFTALAQLKFSRSALPPYQGSEELSRVGATTQSRKPLRSRTRSVIAGEDVLRGNQTMDGIAI